MPYGFIGYALLVLVLLVGGYGAYRGVYARRQAAPDRHAQVARMWARWLKELGALGVPGEASRVKDPFRSLTVEFIRERGEMGRYYPRIYVYDLKNDVEDKSTRRGPHLTYADIAAIAPLYPDLYEEVRLRRSMHDLRTMDAVDLAYERMVKADQDFILDWQRKYGEKYQPVALPDSKSAASTNRPPGASPQGE